ncbi:hypothetical protein TWF481_003169 [Arthrobotrys musiformis]|uniref:Uncharacterized protein n=1 Tax=Arthrobotrys musiformis TaxID=47236 RepID=A0AAV9VS18_9PEZI
MGIARFFTFKRRKHPDTTIPPEVAAEHARDENKTKFSTNIEQNINFESLVLNMMREKDRVSRSRGSGAPSSSWTNERPQTTSSVVGSYQQDDDGYDSRSFGDYSSRGIGLSAEVCRSLNDA